VIENERTVDAPPQAVWDVLADGWLYPVWVVGASRMRGVDAAWPEPGARIHHSVGVWPVLVDDDSEVLEAEPTRRLKLRAKGWPLGEAHVLVELEPVGAGTRVTISEDAVAGPGRWTPMVVRGPMLKWRNTETPRRLAFLAEGGAARG
jgi:uncharacterized protein YndB with AHSA1/START domain